MSHHSKTIKFHFKLKQHVKIKELGLRSTIVELGVNQMGIWYQVRFFNNYTDQFIRFFENELEKV